MIQRFFLIAAALAPLAACGPAAETPAAPAASTAPVQVTDPVDPGRPNAPVARFTPYEGGPLALDEYAVGPIAAQTPFTLEAIQARFPKAQVKKAFLHGDGETGTPIITVDQDGTGILEVSGDPSTGMVGEIRVAGGPAAGPRGEALLMKWSAADMDLPRCRMGQGRDRYAVICTQPGEPVLRYVFGVPGWTKDELPPAQVLADKAFLREFVWKSGAGGYAAP